MDKRNWGTGVTVEEERLQSCQWEGSIQHLWLHHKQQQPSILVVKLTGTDYRKILGLFQLLDISQSLNTYLLPLQITNEEA